MRQGTQRPIHGRLLMTRLLRLSRFRLLRPIQITSPAALLWTSAGLHRTTLACRRFLGQTTVAAAVPALEQTPGRATGFSLLEGVNVVTVTAHDAAGNTATDTLTVTYDPTSPSVAISTPASDPTYSGSPSLDIGGTASDNIAVTEVSWTNDRGGSGVCIGTDTWSASGIALQEGVNVITVTARDAAGNTATDTVTVTYDHIAPQIISVSTAPGMAAGGDAVQVTVVVTDNVAVAAVTANGPPDAWEETTWTRYISASADLGTHSVTVEATDGAGNTSTDATGSYRVASVLGLSNRAAPCNHTSRSRGIPLYSWGQSHCHRLG